MEPHVQWLMWLQMLTNPHAGAVKKYFVKIYKNQSNQKNQKKSKGSISRKSEKATYAKMSVSVDWKPKMEVQAKIRDMYKNDYPDRMKTRKGDLYKS